MMPADELWEVRETLTQALYLSRGVRVSLEKAGIPKEQLLLMAAG